MGRYSASTARFTRAVHPKRARGQSRAKPGERTRPSVANLIKGFDKLRSYVPTYPPAKKLSKIETLRLALLYIKDLTRLVSDAEHGAVSARCDNSLSDCWCPRPLTPSTRTSSTATVADSSATEPDLRSQPFELPPASISHPFTTGVVSPLTSDGSEYSDDSCLLDDMLSLTSSLEGDDAWLAAGLAAAKDATAWATSFWQEGKMFSDCSSSLQAFV